MLHSIWEDINFDRSAAQRVFAVFASAPANIVGVFFVHTRRKIVTKNASTWRRLRRRRKNSAMHKINKFWMTHKLFIFCCHTSIFHCCTSPACTVVCLFWSRCKRLFGSSLDVPWQLKASHYIAFSESCVVFPHLSSLVLLPSTPFFSSIN